MSTITIRKKVIVPEDDIIEVIDRVQRWFDKHPKKKVCEAGIFGFHSFEIKKDNIESDVREAASLAFPYEKPTK
jgi:hypothetical protein